MAVDTDHDEFLTVADIANRLKLNQQTIYNWIDRGQLPAVRVERRARARNRNVRNLDALLGAWPLTKTGGTEADAAWTDIRSAISEARRAANRRDESALKQAIANLANAVERLNTKKTEGHGELPEADLWVRPAVGACAHRRRIMRATWST